MFKTNWFHSLIYIGLIILNPFVCFLKYIWWFFHLLKNKICLTQNKYYLFKNELFCGTFKVFPDYSTESQAPARLNWNHIGIFPSLHCSTFGILASHHNHCCFKFGTLLNYWLFLPFYAGTVNSTFKFSKCCQEIVWILSLCLQIV